MFKWPWKRRTTRYDQREKDIDPDEIFIDSSNLPNFDTHQFEGRLEKPISIRSLFVLSGFVLIIILIFVFRIWDLQISNGDFYFKKSENNRLRNSLVFAKRGVIYDREDNKLAWNVENSADKAYALRKYIPLDGFSHLLGYLKYPSKDKYGFFFSEVLDGKDGVEKYYNNILAGKNGKIIVEVDALGDIQAENIIRKPIDGEDIKLSIQAGIQNKMFSEIKSLAERAGFSGGAGVIMDVNNGEILAMTSFPEYNSQILTDGKDNQAINRYLSGKNTPFLNRVIYGLYAPGSTVKPFMAYAALSENIIDPFKNIYSAGFISIPNPYDSSRPTIFKDWKAHGYTDMKKAIAVSSDVYFYAIGGGFEDQKGLGIVNIDKYMKLFGFGERVAFRSASSTDSNFSFFSGPAGSIPTPEWKRENFPDDPDWRVGNTYHTSIGQYGFLVSPLQMATAVGALANGGKLLEPRMTVGNSGVANSFIDLKLNQDYLKIVRGGMRDSVVRDYGVAKGLNSVDYAVAAKTGTAEIGVYKQFVNSWITGFFPYENPRYTFAIVMEKGPVENLTGAMSVMRQVLDYMAVNTPNYLK